MAAFFPDAATWFGVAILHRTGTRLNFTNPGEDGAWAAHAWVEWNPPPPAWHRGLRAMSKMGYLDFWHLQNWKCLGRAPRHFWPFSPFQAILGQNMRSAYPPPLPCRAMVGSKRTAKGHIRGQKLSLDEGRNKAGQLHFLLDTLKLLSGYGRTPQG